jgi:hypothetical protein
MKVRISNVTNSWRYTLYIPINATHDHKFQTYVIDAAWRNGDHGVIADGNGALFSNFFVSTLTNVKITLATCGLTENQIKQLVNNFLVKIIPSLTLANISYVKSVSGCSKKRAAEELVVTLISTPTINLYIF